MQTKFTWILNFFMLPAHCITHCPIWNFEIASDWKSSNFNCGYFTCQSDDQPTISTKPRAKFTCPVGNQTWIFSSPEWQSVPNKEANKYLPNDKILSSRHPSTKLCINIVTRFYHLGWEEHCFPWFQHVLAWSNQIGQLQTHLVDCQVAVLHGVLRNTWKVYT